MKLTAITVCVNYSDFFLHCVESNKEVFDEWVVITDSKDILTQKLCEKHNLTCVITDIFYEGGRFRKFAGINEGLKIADKNNWILFIDADIVLSPLTRRVLEELSLDKNKMYGVDRLNCNSYERWKSYQRGNGVLKENWLLHSGKMEWGARIVQIFGEEGDEGRFTGYKPLGYFQLVHGSKITQYPEGSENASHGDLAFAKLWDRENRELIPEIMAIHLCTEAYKSMNWEGRKSDEFHYSKETSIFQKIKDFILIFIYSLCKPNYYNKTCFLCKLFKK